VFAVPPRRQRPEARDEPVPADEILPVEGSEKGRRDRAAPLAGRVLAGRYEIGSQIGRGGMASIHLGTDRLLRRKVAVKILAQRFAHDQRSVARFGREAKAAARLNHANVVSIYDTGSDEGIHWIVMEYVEGKTLEEILREEGGFTIRNALDITEALCRALDAAHQGGLIHRDVKPANVMIDGSGQTKVMDFGIARAIADPADLTATGLVLGTASYLSPEQARGDPVDARTDIYSLGCVLYEMVTGGPPFAGGTPLGLAYKHVHEEPLPPSFINQAVPGRLEAVIMRAIAKEPAARYASAEAMRRAISSTLSDQRRRVEATPGPPAGLSEPLAHDTVPLREAGEPVHRSGRERRWFSVVLVALVAMGGFLGARAVLGSGGITVPDVRLLPRERAVDRIEAAGLTAAATMVDRGDVDEGLVFSQSPMLGREGELGSMVRIWVSTGPRLVMVPDFVGREISDAQALAAEHGLTLERSAELPSFEPFGTILAQFPPSGAEVEPGTPIGVVLSDGTSEGDDD
jgi:tRNA A-37 threonylcarbamoyl transferase component Bud32